MCDDTEEAGAEHHAQAVRVAPQNPETSQPATIRRQKTSEDPVAREQEVLTERPRHARGPERLSLHERNRNEAGITAVPDEDFKKIADEAMTQLNSLSGPDFDRAYGTYQLRLLTAVAAQYGAYSQDTNNSAPLRRYAQTEFPKMKEALENVTRLTAGK